MRTASWILTLAIALGVTACGDDSNTTSMTEGSTSNATTGASTGEATTGASTTDATHGSTGHTTTPTTTNTTPATTSDATGESSGGGGMLTCEAYCALYESGCADFAEYDNTQACLDQCSQWPLGTEGAVDGDSLGCRLYHVGVANQADPNTHCPHASPNGGGVCVDPAAPTCADYCTQYLMNCLDANNAYVDEADCKDQCSHWWPGVKDATAGDSVGCRLYHAGAPARSAPTTHCPHAGPGGGGVCVVQ